MNSIVHTPTLFSLSKFEHFTAGLFYVTCNVGSPRNKKESERYRGSSPCYCREVLSQGRQACRGAELAGGRSAGGGDARDPPSGSPLAAKLASTSLTTAFKTVDVHRLVVLFLHLKKVQSPRESELKHQLSTVKTDRQTQAINTKRSRETAL